MAGTNVGDRWKQPPLTPAQVRQLPARVELVDAARALGLGRSTALQLVKDGQFPIPLVRVGACTGRDGGRWFANLSDLLAELGMSSSAGAA